MTNTTQTAIAIARLTRMLNAHATSRKPGQAIPEPPSFLFPPTRADIELVLAVVLRQQQEIDELKRAAWAEVGP